MNGELVSRSILEEGNDEMERIIIEGDGAIHDNIKIDVQLPKEKQLIISNFYGPGSGIFNIATDK